MDSKNAVKSRKIPKTDYPPRYYDVYEVQGVWFRDVEEFRGCLNKALSEARTRLWNIGLIWMAQNRNGEIYLYKVRPHVTNPSRPSMAKWMPAVAHDPSSMIQVCHNLLPKGLEAREWQDSITNYAANAYNALVLQQSSLNAKALERVNTYKARHPFAVAMHRRARRKLA